uniref:Protein YIPF n=1 Tax=Eptatretus burgeri TaxID=7764 RepID=A0A8C4QP64_EPTBU
MAANEFSADFTDVSVHENVPVEGNIRISVPLASEDEDMSTLDEPVKDTIMRDLKAVGKKFVHVLYPKNNDELLRDWDLWGPLIVCVFLAMMLQGKGADSPTHGVPQFAEVFVTVWFGAIVVTFNSHLLGGTISFFQSLCVLGYCIMPLSVSLLLCHVTLLAKGSLPLAMFIVRFICVTLAFAWATFASTTFLGNSQPPNRKALAVYPIFLFYFVISWMIITNVT